MVCVIPEKTISGLLKDRYQSRTKTSQVKKQAIPWEDLIFEIQLNFKIFLVLTAKKNSMIYWRIKQSTTAACLKLGYYVFD